MTRPLSAPVLFRTSVKLAQLSCDPALVTDEQFYDCALELSSAIHMQEVMKSNPKKVDPLAVHAFVSFRLSHSHMPLHPALNSPPGQCVGFPKNL